MQGLSVMLGMWRTSPSFSQLASVPVKKKQEGEIQDPEDSCWVNLDAGEPEGFPSALSGSFSVLKLNSHGAAKVPHG